MPIDEEKKQMREAGAAKEHPKKQETLGDKNNQDMINVIYRAAGQLEMPEWTLLAKVGLEGLVDARSDPYTGPSVADFPELTDEQKTVIQEVLESYVRPKK